MKPTPTSSMQRPTCAGVRLMFTPSASITSALPDLDETARLPCFATRAPAAAQTNVAALEMLKVCAASPPVPTTSTRFSGFFTCDARRELAHHLRGGGDLADRFLLDAQADRDRGDHHRRHLPAHDLPHEVEHLVVEDLAVLDRALQRFLCGDRHDSSSSGLMSANAAARSPATFASAGSQPAAGDSR